MRIDSIIENCVQHTGQVQRPNGPLQAPSQGWPCQQHPPVQSHTWKTHHLNIHSQCICTIIKIPNFYFLEKLYLPIYQSISERKNIFPKSKLVLTYFLSKQSLMIHKKKGWIQNVPSLNEYHLQVLPSLIYGSNRCQNSQFMKDQRKVNKFFFSLSQKLFSNKIQNQQPIKK